MKKLILSIALSAAYSPTLLADIPPQTTPLPLAKSRNYLSTTVFDTYIAQSSGTKSGESSLIVNRNDNYPPENLEAYLGFNLNKYNIGGFLESTELKLHILSEGNADIDVLLVSDDSFWNKEFYWAGKPNTSETLATFSTDERDEDGWVTIPLNTAVLNEIKTDGNLSLALKSRTSQIYSEFSSSEAGEEFAPRLTLKNNSQVISDASSIRYLNVVAATEENGYDEIKIAEFDVINSEGNLITRDNWKVVDGTQIDNWELMFDGEHTTYMRISEGTPNYVNIDLGENIDINALIYTPQKEGYTGRIKDFLVYGSSDNEEWRLISSRAIPSGAGNAPHIAFTGTSYTKPQLEQTFSFNIRPNPALEVERLANQLGRSDLNVLGLLYGNNSDIAIWVPEVAEGDIIELVSGHWTSSQHYRLKQGLNAVKLDNLNGSVAPSFYIKYVSNSSQDYERVGNIKIYGSDVSRYPVYHDGITSETDWQAMIDTYIEANTFEALGKHVWLELRRDNFAPFRFDYPMADTIAAHEEVLIPTQLSAGISDKDNNKLHHQDKNPYHWVWNDGGHLSSTKGTMRYASYLVDDLTDPKLIKNYWGIWHEIGHQLQTPGLKWSGQGEVSVNIYAFAARAYNTPINELSSMYDPRFTNAYDNLTQVSTYSELERASREMMFHHMFFVFGETLMHDLHQRYRENIHEEINDPEFEIGSTDLEQMNVMAIMASKTTEMNLVPFFDFWKFPLTQSTKDTINSYGFPEIKEFDKLPTELVSGKPPEIYDMRF